MKHEHNLSPAAVLSAVAAAIFLTALPAAAEDAPAVTAKIAMPAPASAPLATSAALPAPDAPLAPAVAPACVVSQADARFLHPLPRLARRLVAGRPIKIVALGSSSTFGAGASTPSNSYPSRLAIELAKFFPGHEITVLNRGVNGEEATDMLARMDKSVIAEKPDLVLWQVGTNSVLRDRPVDARAAVLNEGLARLKASGADVILIDPQFAPKVIEKTSLDATLAQIALVAKENNVDLFHRYTLMKHWREDDHFGFDAFVSADGLHMNDWSYSCLAKWLANGIAEAATRPTAVAIGRRAPQ
jgi:lysophospholipase L1-like esterase